MNKKIRIALEFTDKTKVWIHLCNIYISIINNRFYVHNIHTDKELGQITQEQFETLGKVSISETDSTKI